MKLRHIFLFVGLPFLCIAVTLLIFVMRANMGTSWVEGMVVDNETGASLPDTLVAVKNRGWGFVNGSLVWDKDYVYQTTTDSAGRFWITYDVGSSAHMIVTRVGYEPYDGWHTSSSSITIRMKKSHLNYQPLPQGNLELGARSSKPLGWIFSQQRTTLDVAEADLFPDLPASGSGPMQSFTLHAPGGILFVPEDQLAASGDPLVAADYAPVQGYAASITFDPKQSKGVYFVKTRDGRSYAKFTWMSGYVGSNEDIRRGNWGMLFSYVYNPDGSTNLIFQR